MGTRCLTVIKDDTGEEICVLYRQYDGYPSGHGKELKKFLAGKTIINGYGSEKDYEKHFNGMTCLAASLVAHFKTTIGGFYLYPAGTRDTREEYIYEISQTPEGSIEVKTIEA